ncbi:hypothetical protein FQN57_006158 [Myotisia sp. PD_48]|nr:hypothetical protein FQN57_006158 [Myotisia sp. PD_48]
MAAENKRHVSGAKGPGGPMQQNFGPSGTISLEKALGQAIGARVRVTTSQPGSITLEGTLFTACPITNLLAINSSPPSTSPQQPASLAETQQSLLQTGDFHILPIARVHTFQLLSMPPQSISASSPSSSSSPNSADPTTPFANAQPSIHSLDIRALRNREATAIAKLRELEAQRGKGVSKEAQALFDAFRRTMPTRWEGTSIVVADTVVISKPYGVNDCKPLGSQNEVAGTALTRVRKVLEMERKKIDLRNASTAMNSGNFARPPPANKADAATRNNPSPVANTTPRDNRTPVAVPIRNTGEGRFSPGPNAPVTGQRKGG